MGYPTPAYLVAALEGSARTVDPVVLGRLDTIVIVLAGILIIGAVWDWLKRR